MGSNRVSEIRVNESRVRIWARVTKFRVRANFRVSMLRVRLRLRAKTTLNHRSPSNVDGWMGNVQVYTRFTKSLYQTAFST